IKSSDDMEDVFNQGRMIDDLDKDEGIKLDADTTETEGRHAAEQTKKQAEIYHLDLDHPSKVLSIQEDDSEVQEIVDYMLPPPGIFKYGETKVSVEVPQTLEYEGGQLNDAPVLELVEGSQKHNGVTPLNLDRSEMLNIQGHYFIDQ
nr:hypothetical protein [Tanacetum cinerariifolium]